MKKPSNSWLRVLSGLCTNLSAGAIGLILITPSFLPFDSTAFLSLTYDVGIAILFMLAAVKLDEAIKYD